MNTFRLLLILSAFSLAVFADANEVRYDLAIAKQQVDLAGAPVTAITVNGGLLVGYREIFPDLGTVLLTVASRNVVAYGCLSRGTTVGRRVDRYRQVETPSNHANHILKVVYVDL